MNLSISISENEINYICEGTLFMGSRNIRGVSMFSYILWDNILDEICLISSLFADFLQDTVGTISDDIVIDITFPSKKSLIVDYQHYKEIIEDYSDSHLKQAINSINSVLKYPPILVEGLPIESILNSEKEG